MTARKVALALVAVTVAVLAAALASRRGTERPVAGRAESVVAPARGAFAGLVTDGRGRPVAARVEALVAGDDPLPAHVGSTHGSPEGVYRIQAAAPPGSKGAVILRVSAPGFATEGRVVDPETTRQDFVLLEARAAITVRVVTESGAAVDGADVVVSVEPRAGAPGSVAVFDGKTGPDGVLVLEDVGARAATVHFSARSRGRGAVHGELDLAEGRASLEIVARLRDGVRLAGRVVDGGGRPVRGASIRVGEADGPWADEVESGGDGTFALDGVPRGRLSLEVAGDWVLSGADETAHVVVPEDARAHTVELVVEPGGAIAGRARTRAGDAVSGATVVATPSGADTSHPKVVRTDAEGRFVVRGLRARTRWVLQARRDDLAPAFVEDVAAGASSVELVLEGGGAVAGRVVDDRGAAAEGVEIYAHRVERDGPVTRALREYAFARSGSGGEYTVGHLAPGHYRVEVRPPTRIGDPAPAPRVFDAVVHDARTTSIETVSVPRAGDIEVVVRVSDGSGAPRAFEVALARRGSSTPQRVGVHAREDGTFRLAPVAPGEYTMTIFDDVRGYASVPVEVRAGLATKSTVAYSDRVELSGVVTGSDGRPVVAAEVDVYAADDEHQRSHELPGRAPGNLTGNRAVTGERGEFRVQGLVPGRYRVRVSKHGEPPAVVDVTAPSTAIDVALAAPSSLEVVLPPGGPTADRVVVAETSEGAGARVHALTDSRGVARFSGMAAGEYRVRAIVPGAPEVKIRLGSGEHRTTTLKGG